MIKRVVIFIVLFSLAGSFCFAESIVFKSGETKERKIIEQTDEYIKVDFEGVPITYSLMDIESIDGKPIIMPKTAEDYLIQKGYLSGDGTTILKPLPRSVLDEVYKKFGYWAVNRILSKWNTNLMQTINEACALLRDNWNSAKNASIDRLNRGYNLIENNEDMAQRSLGYIGASWVSFYEHTGKNPRSLSDLVNADPPCLDKDFDDSDRNPKIFGYEFIFFPIEGNKSYAVAKPIVEGKTGNKYFIVVQQGIVIEDLNKNSEIDPSEEQLIKDEIIKSKKRIFGEDK